MKLKIVLKSLSEQLQISLGLLTHWALPSPFELEPPYRHGSSWAEDPQDLPLTSILESFILNSRKLMKSQKYIFSLDD